jgi:hypothetical protein
MNHHVIPRLPGLEQLHGFHMQIVTIYRRLRETNAPATATAINIKPAGSGTLPASLPSPLPLPKWLPKFARQVS